MKKKAKKLIREYDIKDVKSPSELIKIYSNEPDPTFYWRGIEDVSFGYVFGPSKAGKTIFCENIAMSLAVGRNTFFKSKMIGEPKRVFLVAMEEDYRKRTRRMQKQMSELSESETQLFNDNVIIAGQTFPRFMVDMKQWEAFEVLVEEISPDVIIIDSLTRMMKGDITNRDICKEILARLRNFAYDNGLCLLMIHHSTKNNGKPLTMDSMAGSSVMSQEADFSIGLNRNELTNQRYLKEVFYRYEESNDLVNLYEIDNKSNWLIPTEESYESRIINNSGEKSANNYEKVISYLETKAEEKLSENDQAEKYFIKVSELKKEFVQTNTMPSRTFDYTLMNIVKNNILIPDGSKGTYTYLIKDLRNLRNMRNNYLNKTEGDVK